jgi:hypothetical protein
MDELERIVRDLAKDPYPSDGEWGYCSACMALGDESSGPLWEWHTDPGHPGKQIFRDFPENHRSRCPWARAFMWVAANPL